uniref:C-type lectin domain family 4 member G-like n=1 Tax=Crassostrea virginica TaxID=6565 RepID=A0A8B8C292_CRAVI|nr:C-type lectin domain family 4 member G-like [Crassostrea virginica]
MTGFGFLNTLWVIAFTFHGLECSNQCENGWVEFERGCYFFSNNKMSFKDAMVTCYNMGGALLELQNRLEENWLDIHRYHHGFWVGVTDIHIENHFVALSNGRTPHYIHWAKGEPNDHAGKEDCTVHLLSTKAWNDTPCSSKVHFVCKKEIIKTCIS